MGILRTLIGELKTKDITEQVRQLCDRISKEEKESIEHDHLLPEGPNIFLALEVPGRTKKEVAYLTLERESEDVYLTVMYTISIVKMRKPDASLKRQRVWEIQDHRPEKILTEYAKVIKLLRGE